MATNGIYYNYMKSIFTSKVFWLAVLQALAGTLVIFETSYPTLGYLVIVKSVVDIVLRYYTTTPVNLTGKA